MVNNLITRYDFIISKQSYVEIQMCNKDTLEYGVKLSDEDIKTIIKTRSEALSSNGRVEFGGGIIKKIITAFCDSPHISQYNYAETINDLIETFYYYKNETLEKISDDELINLMKEYFNNECEGSIELLRDKYLDGAANDIKFGVTDCLYIDTYEELEEEK